MPWLRGGEGCHVSGLFTLCVSPSKSCFWGVIPLHICAKVPNVQKTMAGVVEWGKAELEEMKKKAPKQN